MMPGKDRACTKLCGLRCADGACPQRNFFLLTNTLLERTLVGAWIGNFQKKNEKAVASYFLYSVREKIEELKNLM